MKIRYLTVVLDTCDVDVKPLLLRLLDGLRHKGLKLGHEDVREVVCAGYRGRQRVHHDFYVPRLYAGELDVEPVLKSPEGRREDGLDKGPREVIATRVNVPGERGGHFRR